MIKFLVKLSFPLLFAAQLLGCVTRFPVSPAAADASVFEVLTASGAQATGFVLASGYAMTAGHVCVHATEPGKDHETYARTATGRMVPLKIVMFEMSEGPEADLCLMTFDVDALGPAMVLAREGPSPGMIDHTLGFPRDVHTLSSGVYLGGGILTDSCDHGLSGGPAFTLEGVFGVVVQMPPVGVGCAVTMLPEIEAFANTANVPYDTAPDPLPTPPSDDNVLGML